ncbi:hypothetical protein, partial [Klebsiella pneumoniae]|uniref:hypothetical protein n=1 Tax=Klebsiella pneumoniae TaxID=573 RepID=UPI001D0F3349
GPFFPNYQVKNINLLKQRVAEATGCTIHDYSTAIQDRSSFTDYLHANLKGGKEIVDLMIRDGVLIKADSIKTSK